MPHHATRAVEIELVPNAIPIRANLAKTGSPEEVSSRNMKGDMTTERDNEDSENILRRRNVAVNGASYSVGVGVGVGVVDSVR